MKTRIKRVITTFSYPGLASSENDVVPREYFFSTDDCQPTGNLPYNPYRNLVLHSLEIPHEINPKLDDLKGSTIKIITSIEEYQLACHPNDTLVANPDSKYKIPEEELLLTVKRNRH
jgi:hypothetical protein